MSVRKEMELGGRTLSIEVGKVAKQADGAAWVQYGDTIALVTVVSAKEKTDNTDFFPLSVDYREKMYAGGKIPGGFFKREARPREAEVLTARLIDRPLRPLFPDGYYYETQILVTVVSHDGQNEADILGSIGASTALLVSDIPFTAGVASVNVGRIEGQFVLNPMLDQKEASDIEILVAGTRDAILMVEGEAKEVDESVFLDALEFAHREIGRIIDLQDSIKAEIGKPTREWEPVKVSVEIAAAVKERAEARVKDIVRIKEKAARRNAEKQLAKDINEALTEQFPDGALYIAWALEDIIKEQMREMVLEQKVRLDGRGTKDIRPITCEVGVLPRAHGSALFTRGQTQSLGACTLGTKMDEQKIDGLAADYWKTFMLHYNFPPFSTGEIKRNLGTGRREQGHGHLAERAIKGVLPPWEEFPYTVRIVSDILESNGSSSMASVCSGTLSAMDAGVPLKRPVAGIAMGLIKSGDRYAILSDILGDEDHLGDMDFKVAGSRDGITAFQMDIKIGGLSKQIMAEALAQAKEGRYHILSIMDETLSTPRSSLSEHAPRIRFVHIDPEMIGMVIGPGGRTIRQLQSDYGVNIDIDDDGTVCISSTTEGSSLAAYNVIVSMTQEPEVGKVYEARVVKIMDFGAFCEIFPGKEGLLHVSEIAWKRIDKVDDVLKVGDSIQVKLMNINDQGKLDLSHKVLLPKPEGYVEKERTPRPSGGSGGGGSRGGKPPFRGGSGGGSGFRGPRR